jgi:toxin ParE1/3/4
MKRFVLHPEAYTDLDEVWEYVASDNVDAADRIREEKYNAVGELVAFPNQGHKRPDLTLRRLDFQVVRDYLIAYAPDVNPFLVIAVLHGRRSPRAIASILGRRQ